MIMIFEDYVAAVLFTLINEYDCSKDEAVALFKKYAGDFSKCFENDASVATCACEIYNYDN